MKDHDPINRPAHYTSHPSGAECIEIAEWFPFNLGNAIKYIWRCGKKGDEIEDLRKARWYLDREILRRENDIQQREEKVTGKLHDPIVTAWGSISQIDGEAT